MTILEFREFDTQQWTRSASIEENYSLISNTDKSKEQSQKVIMQSLDYIKT